MAEDRKDNLHQAEPIITGPPLKQPLASDAPQAAAFSEASKLPGYVAWLELQYHQQLEAAIANMSGGTIPPFPRPQANAQRSPQCPLTPAAPTGLKNAFLPANMNSPFADQQWMDNRAPQVVPPASLEFRSGQNMLYPTELPAMAASDSTLSPSMDYLSVMAQQSMLNAAEGGQGRQATVDRVVGQPQFGGKQQFLHVSVCLSCLSHGHALLLNSGVTVSHCRCVTVQQNATCKAAAKDSSSLCWTFHFFSRIVLLIKHEQAEMCSPDLASVVDAGAACCHFLY